MTPEKSNSI